MLPIVDYGSIAIVIPNVSAVGPVVKKDGKYGFEVFLNGKEDPVFVGSFASDEADESRKELVGIIAQYYYVREFGPDFELDDLVGEFDEEVFEDDEFDDSHDQNIDADYNDDNDNKKEH